MVKFAFNCAEEVNGVETTAVNADATSRAPDEAQHVFVAREFDSMLLGELPPDVDPCGERGEFHTFAYDGPMFARRIEVATGVIVERDGFVFADLVPSGDL